MNFTDEIESLKAIGQYRQFRQIAPCEKSMAMLNNRKLVNLSSNDYLGLSTDETLLAEFQSMLPQLTGSNPYGACSSRLLTGNYPLYHEVETLLEQMYGRPALFFNSGYHANMGILPALTTKDDLILSDKLVHASIIDGIRLSTATHLRYRHLDYQQLEKTLSEKRHLYKNVFIVTESVFSMDGDCADLRRLAEIKNRFDAFLYVDEAHAVGAMGENGLGLCEVQNITEDIDLLIGTLGKAYASVGAWVTCHESVKQLLINKCRTLIFTTALPPINMAWSWLMMSKMQSFQPRRIALQQTWQHLAETLNNKGIRIDAQSHILPIMVGENHAAMALAQQLQDEGFLVMAVRPPTVPVGTARLRLSLTSSIDKQDIERLAEKLLTHINK